MKFRMRLFAMALFLSCAVVADDARMTLADLGREVGLSNAVLSPDGRHIALVVSRAEYADNRHMRRLVLLDVATGMQREPAPGRSDISSPKWSPTGRKLAWLDRVDGKSQIHVMSLSESVSSVVAATKVNGGIRSYEWSPDGESFAFLSVDAQPERTGEERHNVSFEVADNDFLAGNLPIPSYLGLVDLATGQDRKLASGPETVKGFAWLPDGRSIAFTTEPGARVAGSLQASLKLVEIETGQQKTLLDASQASDAPLQSLYSVSPDGSLIAYGRVRGPQSVFRSNGIVVMPPSGGEDRRVTAAIDRSFREMVWLPDGKSFIANAADGTRDAAWLVSLKGAVRKLDLGAVTQVSGMSISKRGALAFIGTQAQRPAELYFMESPTAKPRRLTRFNDDLAALDLGRVDSVRWSLDGFEQSGVLIYPPGFRQGQKYPLVLNIHGGPMSTSAEAFSAFDQLLAAQGWLVFAPNYRGSRSLGDEFQRAIINDAGDGPGRDVMAGVAAVKALGIVDHERMAVSGWSYGGYLTAWLTSHYPVWRGAVAAAAVTDWFDSYNLGDLNVFFGYGLGGSPWLRDNAANYWRQSPMAYAHRIRTPLLILSTTGDTRVPVTQSYKLYRALKDNSVPVQFIAYSQSGHMPADPVNQRDWYRRWMGWIDERFHAPAYRHAQE